MCRSACGPCMRKAWCCVLLCLSCIQHLVRCLWTEQHDSSRTHSQLAQRVPMSGACLLPSPRDRFSQRWCDM